MGRAIVKRKICRLLIIFFISTHGLAICAQRKLECKVKINHSETYLRVNYKGKKGDYLRWTSPLFYIPQEEFEIIYDSINEFSPNLSFISDGDLIPYQLKSVHALDSVKFEKLKDMFNPEFNDYTNRDGIKHRRKKFKLPLSIDDQIILLKPTQVRFAITVSEFWLSEESDHVPIYLETYGKVIYR